MRTATASDARQGTARSSRPSASASTGTTACGLMSTAWCVAAWNPPAPSSRSRSTDWFGGFEVTMSGLRGAVDLEDGDAGRGATHHGVSSEREAARAVVLEDRDGARGPVRGHDVEVAVQLEVRRGDAHGLVAPSRVHVEDRAGGERAVAVAFQRGPDDPHPVVARAGDREVEDPVGVEVPGNERSGAAAADRRDVAGCPGRPCRRRGTRRPGSSPRWPPPRPACRCRRSRPRRPPTC